MDKNNVATAFEMRFELVPPAPDGKKRETIIYPSDAMKMVRAGVPGLPDVLFGHGRHQVDAADGQTRRDFPIIRWGGGHRHVRILGLGDEGRRVVMEAFPLLYDFFSAETGRAIRTECLQHSISAEGRSTSSLQVHQFCVTTKYSVADAYRSAEPAARIEQIKERIRSSLYAQAKYLNIALPPYNIINVTADDLDLVPVKKVGGDTSWGFVIPRLTVTLSMRLHGPWYVGRLVSKGYGRTEPARMVRTTTINEEEVADVPA